MTAFNLDNLLLLPITATVREMAITEVSLRNAINLAIANVNAASKEAAASKVEPVGANQQPRMLQIDAWIAHADRPNRNNQAFLADDLRECVANGLFKAPFVGMIDWNHDFTARGAWYDATFEYDPVAKAFGILAKGAIWSWRYEEETQELLAIQARFGKIDVSIAALYQKSEMVELEGGQRHELIRHPVFFTTSVLNVDPADPHARGLASEDTTQTSEQRTAELLKASLNLEAQNSEEVQMDELMKKIEAMFGEQKAELAPLMAAVAKLSLTEAELATATAASITIAARLADMETAITTANASVIGLTADKTALETAVATAEVALATANAALVALTAENEALVAFKTDIEATRATELKVVNDAARTAEIPEAVMATLDLDKDEDKALLAKWMEQSDDEFIVTKRLFSMASTTRSTHADRTAREGTLSSAAEVRDGDFAISKWAK